MRLTALLASVGIAVTLSTSATAGPLHALFRDIHTSYHRNKCWPQPFVYPDNAAARAPFARMIHNGWRVQTLVAGHHFTDGTDLTDAGERHIRWIVTQAPVRRRTVYIEQGKTPEDTRARVAAAQDYAQRFAMEGHTVNVQPTHIMARGVPADYVDAINVKFFESTPDPRLSDSSGGVEGQ